ncbi:hypothetical protein BYT27DRAFT_7251256 [Phlegmacium glaucopus]|nr:hypothetical protein BYT27DRAFT_7251256 [Phlegmacium glaucopus]
MFLSQSLITSCPEARHIGFTKRWALPPPFLHTIINHCPRLEVLEEFEDLFWKDDTCKLIVDKFPNLRTVTVSPSETIAHHSHIDILKKLNHLQTIVLLWKPALLYRMLRCTRHDEQVAHLNRIKEGWIERAKHILMQIQLRDNLEKTVITRNYEGEERKILIKAG